MTELELLKYLYYPGKNNMREYTQGNHFISEMYKIFLDVKGRRTDLNFRSIDFFNEVYYQCTRLYNDPAPEDNTQSEYFIEVEGSFRNEVAVYLIYSMIYAIFYVMKNKSEGIEFLLVHLKAILDSKKNTSFWQFQTLAENYVRESGLVEFDFPITPYPPLLFPDGKSTWSTWRNITFDFDQMEVRNIVGLYDSMTDKMDILSIIEDAYDEAMEQEKTYPIHLKHIKTGKHFFHQLKNEISISGGITPKNVVSTVDNLALMINEYHGDNFDAFLKAYDWHSIPSEEIIPREKIRTLIKAIKDKETRLQTARFLRKYEDYYFEDVTDESGILSVYSVADFHRELNYLIEQTESEGEFSVSKIDEMNAENLKLKKHIESLEEVFGISLKTALDWSIFDETITRLMESPEKVKKLESENADLIKQVQELKGRVDLKGITIQQICEYASNLETQSDRILFHSLLTKYCKNTTIEEEKLIEELLMPQKKSINVDKLAMGDIVQKKYVKS